jgi:DNA-binding NarL/FixJ family response regulator
MIAGLPERAKYEQAAVATREALGEEAFAAGWSAGRALALRQAIAEAHDLVSAVASEPPVADPSAAHGLTPRELEVLRLLVEGRSDKEIGAALFIGHRTAQDHVSNLIGKLGVANRTEAAAVAVRAGMI